METEKISLQSEVRKKRITEEATRFAESVWGSDVTPRREEIIRVAMLLGASIALDTLVDFTSR